MAQGRRRIALVGHSFGVVVIATGAARGSGGGRRAQRPEGGNRAARALAPRVILLVHSLVDEILSTACSCDLHRRVAEPKEIILYPECRHGLEECRGALDRDLIAWLSRFLG